MEKPNLLWEIIRFFLQIVYAIDPISKRLKKSLSHDLSHFHYFLESEFGYTDMRCLNYTSCKNLLKSHLDELSLLFYVGLHSKAN